MKKIVAVWCLLTVLCVSCLSAAAEEAAPFRFCGASWGVSQKQIRWLMGIAPIQEPVAMTGHAALIYQTKVEGFPCVIQYGFLPEDALFSIEVVVSEDGESFFEVMAESLAAQYGEPMTADQAEAGEGGALGQIMEGFLEASMDGECLGWQPDGDTVVILNLDAGADVCYVECQRLTGGAMPDFSQE